MATIDMNRTTTIKLPGAVSAEIWQKAQEGSAVMSLARRITLPGLGVTIPIITGDPEAGWVGETEKKPVKPLRCNRQALSAFVCGATSELDNAPSPANITIGNAELFKPEILGNTELNSELV